MKSGHSFDEGKETGRFENGNAAQRHCLKRTKAAIECSALLLPPKKQHSREDFRKSNTGPFGSLLTPPNDPVVL